MTLENISPQALFKFMKVEEQKLPFQTLTIFFSKKTEMRTYFQTNTASLVLLNLDMMK